ncbi:hypothetical protein [Amycolatopsis vancoresmycina]|uniref:Uncharacterized protein n=1 Tax=Amycolatopsis vancoresmycina DSM 44592 TaxID=1292037 RepID=R1HX53_9PSEU|nr:hypothetical protein [Amycolatopsis vancoresmycina]EOD68125.1 hypothetical protein H480_13009 [Amycolatopsis vancoresmycina DSM 44592]
MRGGVVPDEPAPSVEHWRRDFAMVKDTRVTTDLEALRIALSAWRTDFGFMTGTNHDEGDGQSRAPGAAPNQTFGQSRKNRLDCSG